VTAAVGLRDLEDPAFRVATHLQIVKRLGFVGTYARKNGEGKVAARLGRAQASAAMAARGDWSAHLRAVDQLNALAAWAQSAGAALRWL
jgi:hypothetical protein